MSDKIFVTRATLPDMQEYVDEISSLWESHWITNMGAKHKQLQKELIDYLSVDHLELLVNGHMALEMSLQALNLQGEVITTPFTFASTTHAIVRNNLDPVFCDIDPKDFTIDVSKLERLITDRTCAILPVHVYGNVCNVEEIQRIADIYKLKVIYDAAHAFGETYDEKGIGNYGNVSCFSFHATKVFNTIEGGAVTFHDSVFGDRIRDLKNFGIHGQEEVVAVGANGKMNEFCAAMGICNLRHVEDGIEKRKKVYEHYCNYLKDIEGLQLNVIQPKVKHNYAYFPVVFDETVLGFGRDEVYKALAEEGIFARKYFHPLTNMFSAFHGKYRAEETPVALHVSKRILTLPIYADLAFEEVERICKIITSMKK